MKKLCFVLPLSFSLLVGSRLQAQDPVTEIIKQALIKALKAIDLKVQRLQTKTIWLQNAQKTLENAMSKAKLEEISGWVSDQKKLYEDYFTELWKVKDVVAGYEKVKALSLTAVAIVKEYERAIKGIPSDAHFSFSEVTYLISVYQRMLQHSGESLEQVQLALQSFTTRMSDAAREQIIDEAAEALQETYRDIKTFTEQNLKLSLARGRSERELRQVRQLYGLK